MKKFWGITLFLFLPIISLYSQIPDNEYSTIYFYTGRIKDDVPVKVYIENQKAFTLIGEQLVVYRIFSQGRIEVKFTKDGNFYQLNQFTLNIEPQRNYFIESQFSDLGQLLYKSDSLSVIRKYKKAKLDTIKREESEFSPFKERIKIKTGITGNGTGFLVSQTGVVITNSHVVKDAKKVYVKITNGLITGRFESTVIYDDKSNDIALLQLNDSNLQFDSIPYNFRSFGVQTGEEVSTLGYPMLSTMGTEIKLTTGVISSTTGYQNSLSSYQISVPAQPGNSGSPVFDSYGNLVGIINSKIIGLEGVTYAIKSAFITPDFDAAKIPNSMLKTPSKNKLSLVDLVSLYSKFIFIIEIEE